MYFCTEEHQSRQIYFRIYRPCCSLKTNHLPPTKEEVTAFAGVRLSVLSVCLLARLLKNACIDLDEMLRVDRCRDMDKLINFWVRSGLWSGCRNRIACPTSYALQRAILLRRENPMYRYWEPVAAAKRGFKMVLFTASRGNNFVGGTCAPPSALLVLHSSGAWFATRLYVRNDTT